MYETIEDNEVLGDAVLSYLRVEGIDEGFLEKLERDIVDWAEEGITIKTFIGKLKKAINKELDVE